MCNFLLKTPVWVWVWMRQCTWRSEMPKQSSNTGLQLRCENLSLNCGIFYGKVQLYFFNFLVVKIHADMGQHGHLEHFQVVDIPLVHWPLWRHDMEKLSASLALCEGNPLVTGGGSPGGGTPYVMGDTYVPRFWPPFFTLAGSSTIFLGYFNSSTNSKAIFWGTKTTNFYKNRSFWPQIQFFPRSFWVQFSAASGTPPSVFRPSTPPGVVPLTDGQ